MRHCSPLRAGWVPVLVCSRVLIFFAPILVLSLIHGAAKYALSVASRRRIVLGEGWVPSEFFVSLILIVANIFILRKYASLR